MSTRHATAVWQGRLRDGEGTFTGESGVVSGDYSFGSRFERRGGGTPEELLAAAQAACFSMALAAALERAGTPATRVETHAACTLERVADAHAITRMHLTVSARVPGADRDTFKDLAEATTAACPISKALLGNVDLEIDATLEEDDGPMAAPPGSEQPHAARADTSGAGAADAGSAG
jgi:osmotically inducible protein OsmC